MKTAENITDEEIRELASKSFGNSPVLVDCHLALFGSGGPRSDARAKCAEHLNAGPNYSARAAAAIAAVDGWTTQDFIDLALAAADQAGATVHDQRHIAALLNTRKARP